MQMARHGLMCDSLLAAGGLESHRVILSTFTLAADEDYSMTILSDACADPKTSLHEELMPTCFLVLRTFLPSINGSLRFLQRDSGSVAPTTRTTKEKQREESTYITQE
jgi:hypothetical protein